MADADSQRTARPADILATVVAVRAVTPRMRRVVFQADGLAAAFATPADTHGPYLKLVIETADGPRIRTYSIRHLDSGRAELHVDFLIHDDGGPGSAFARTAAAGTVARLRGPGFLAVARCGEHRLAADHSAAPALAHILDRLPAAARGHAVIEVPDTSEIQSLPTRSEIDVVWLIRKVGEPSQLSQHLAGLPVTKPNDTLIWAGAEASIARRIRNHARQHWQIPPQQCQVLNYWKLGRPEGEFSYVA